MSDGPTTMAQALRYPEGHSQERMIARANTLRQFWDEHTCPSAPSMEQFDAALRFLRGAWQRGRSGGSPIDDQDVHDLLAALFSPTRDGTTS